VAVTRDLVHGRGKITAMSIDRRTILTLTLAGLAGSLRMSAAGATAMRPTPAEKVAAMSRRSAFGFSFEGLSGPAIQLGDSAGHRAAEGCSKLELPQISDRHRRQYCRRFSKRNRADRHPRDYGHCATNQRPTAHNAIARSLINAADRNLRSAVAPRAKLR